MAKGEYLKFAQQVDITKTRNQVQSKDEDLESQCSYDVEDDETFSDLSSCEEHYRKRQVKFDVSTGLIKYIPTRYEYTDKEKRRCWYTADDRAKMRAREKRTVARLKAGIPPKRGQTYRGLESLTEKGGRLSEMLIKRCIDAVMDEQERQWSEYTDDFNKIAVICKESSWISRQLAWKIAQYDAEEAKEIMEGGEEIFRSRNLKELGKARWHTCQQ